MRISSSSNSCAEVRIRSLRCSARFFPFKRAGDTQLSFGLLIGMKMTTVFKMQQCLHFQYVLFPAIIQFLQALDLLIIAMFGKTLINECQSLA